MNNETKNIIPLVKSTVLDAALAFELHKGKTDHWRRVFKKAINELPIKAGTQYRFLVRMSEQSKEAMDRVVGTLCREVYL